MSIRCCANKFIIAEIHTHSQILEILRYSICERLWVNTSFLCCNFHFLPMLISAGEKLDPMAVTSLETRQNITGERGVSMANMRLIIHVINWRCDIIGFIHCTGFLTACLVKISLNWICYSLPYFG